MENLQFLEDLGRVRLKEYQEAATARRLYRAAARDRVVHTQSLLARVRHVLLVLRVKI